MMMATGARQCSVPLNGVPCGRSALGHPEAGSGPVVPLVFASSCGRRSVCLHCAIQQLGSRDSAVDCDAKSKLLVDIVNIFADGDLFETFWEHSDTCEAILVALTEGLCHVDPTTTDFFLSALRLFVDRCPTARISNALQAIWHQIMQSTMSLPRFNELSSKNDAIVTLLVYTLQVGADSGCDVPEVVLAFLDGLYDELASSKAGCSVAMAELLLCSISLHSNRFDYLLDTGKLFDIVADVADDRFRESFVHFMFSVVERSREQTRWTRSVIPKCCRLVCDTIRCRGFCETCVYGLAQLVLNYETDIMDMTDACALECLVDSLRTETSQSHAFPHVIDAIVALAPHRRFPDHLDYGTRYNQSATLTDYAVVLETVLDAACMLNGRALSAVPRVVNLLNILAANHKPDLVIALNTCPRLWGRTLDLLEVSLQGNGTEDSAHTYLHLPRVIHGLVSAMPVAYLPLVHNLLLLAMKCSRQCSRMLLNNDICQNCFSALADIITAGFDAGTILGDDTTLESIGHVLRRPDIQNVTIDSAFALALVIAKRAPAQSDLTAACRMYGLFDMACDVLSTRSAACELVHVRRFVSVSVLAVCPPFVTNDENHDAVMLSSGDWTLDVSGLCMRLLQARDVSQCLEAIQVVIWRIQMTRFERHDATTILLSLDELCRQNNPIRSPVFWLCLLRVIALVETEHSVRSVLVIDIAAGHVCAMMCTKVLQWMQSCELLWRWTWQDDPRGSLGRLQIAILCTLDNAISLPCTSQVLRSLQKAIVVSADMHERASLASLSLGLLDRPSVAVSAETCSSFFETAIELLTTESHATFRQQLCRTLATIALAHPHLFPKSQFERHASRFVCMGNPLDDIRDLELLRMVLPHHALVQPGHVAVLWDIPGQLLSRWSLLGASTCSSALSLLRTHLACLPVNAATFTCLKALINLALGHMSTTVRSGGFELASSLLSRCPAILTDFEEGVSWVSLAMVAVAAGDDAAVSFVLQFLSCCPMQWLTASVASIIAYMPGLLADLPERTLRLIHLLQALVACDPDTAIVFLYDTDVDVLMNAVQRSANPAYIVALRSVLWAIDGDSPRIHQLSDWLIRQPPTIDDPDAVPFVELVEAIQNRSSIELRTPDSPALPYATPVDHNTITVPAL